MARPLKLEIEKKSCRLPHIRCTQNVYDCIKMRADEAGLNLSAFVCQMALEGEIKIIKSENDNAPKLDFTVFNELKKIGVNINQQTRKLNTHAQLPAALPPLWEKLDKILDHFLDHLNIE